MNLRLRMQHIDSAFYRVAITLTLLLTSFSPASTAQGVPVANWPNVNKLVIETSSLLIANFLNIPGNYAISAESGIFANDADPVEEGNQRGDLLHPPPLKEIISFWKIFWTLIFISAGYFILKLISGILNLFLQRKPKHKTLILRLLPIVKIAGWSLIVYIIISGIFQPPAEMIFAFFASVGVAIGFASQDLLKNIFGGLMILLDKPFQIGDKIESGRYYGEVIEIGLRSTRIVTPDDSIVAIPNSEMMSQSISNANSGANNCQVVAELFLPVLIDANKVRRMAIEAAQVSRYIYLNKPVVVEFSNVLVPKGSFLKMRLKAYVLDVKYEFPFQSEMTEIMLRELKNEKMLDDTQ